MDYEGLNNQLIDLQVRSEGLKEVLLSSYAHYHSLLTAQRETMSAVSLKNSNESLHGALEALSDWNIRAAALLRLWDVVSPSG